MEQRSFCIVGPQGSGKSTAASRLREMFPNHVYMLSSRLWEKMAGRDMTHYEKTVFQKNIVDERGEQFFVDMFIGEIEKKLAEDSGAKFIVDGIRSREVFDALRKFFGAKMLFIGMTADDSVRKQRSAGRDADGGKFEDREMRDDSQFHVKDLVGLCDAVIVNNFQSRDELFSELESKISSA